MVTGNLVPAGVWGLVPPPLEEAKSGKAMVLRCQMRTGNLVHAGVWGLVPPPLEEAKSKVLQRKSNGSEMPNDDR